MHNFSRVLVIFGTVIAVLAVLASGGALAGPPRPFITATQASYLPGENPIILGFGFQPGQELVIKITRPDGSVVNASGEQGSDTVVVNALGQIEYHYPQTAGLKGLYAAEAIDSASVVLSSTVFEDPFGIDLELFGMPDVALFRATPPPRGVGGADGLVDAIAGRCLVGTVEIRAFGNDDDVRGIFFDLVPDRQSNQQPSPGPFRDFIDRLETVGSTTSADPDTGSAAVPEGGFWTTTDNVITGTAASPFRIQTLDGTWFEVVGPTAGPNAGEETYRVTVCGVTCTNSSVGNASAIADARFEYCARLDPLAGDSDDGDDGTITSTPQTGGTETSPINVVQPTDTSPPVCVLQIISGGIQVTASDPQSGIQSIVETRKVNATTSYNPHQPPPLTFNNVIVTALKVNPAQPSSLTLRITNGIGLVTTCDPVDFELVRDNGRPVRHNFPLEVGEGYLHINNDGLQQITMNLNGSILRFSTTAQGAGVYQMPEFGEVNYDLTDYLVPDQNSVEITAVGRRGGSARIVIHDIGN
jgi:hypothetical protein